jgi:hypothetical protein
VGRSQLSKPAAIANGRMERRYRRWKDDGMDCTQRQQASKAHSIH